MRTWNVIPQSRRPHRLQSVASRKEVTTRWCPVCPGGGLRKPSGTQLGNGRKEKKKVEWRHNYESMYRMERYHRWTQIFSMCRKLVYCKIINKNKMSICIRIYYGKGKTKRSENKHTRPCIAQEHQAIPLSGIPMWTAMYSWMTQLIIKKKVYERKKET